MISVTECLQQTWLGDLLIGLTLYVAFSLCLIIILIAIIFKLLNKDKSSGASNVNNQELKGGNK